MFLERKGVFLKDVFGDEEPTDVMPRPQEFYGGRVGESKKDPH